MQFHERLKEYRKKMRLTQVELAEKLYVSRSAVAKWESGLGLPSDDSLNEIAKLFGVNREELIADRETETIIVEKNGKLSRQKTYLIVLIVLASALLIAAAIILGVFLTRGNNGDFDDNAFGEDDVTVAGIDKNDPYTWFDVNKTDLPSLETCRAITRRMSLNQVIGKLGKPQRNVGSDAFLFQFDLDDGFILTITFDIDLWKQEQKPNLSTYDYLIVCELEFDPEIPNLHFHYGPLHNLYSWINELNVEDIVQVRFEHAFIGVAPGNLKDIRYITNKDIRYTTNRVDIENSYRLLSSIVQEVSDEEGQISGGDYIQYDFLTADNETYSITVCNNTVFINQKSYKKYYKFVGNFYYAFQYSDLDCHSFITYIDEYEIYTYAEDSVKVGNYDGLGEFEFCIYDGLIENVPSYCLRSSELNLLILSSNQFMIEGDNATVYQIIGKKDFSALFAESSE